MNNFFEEREKWVSEAIKELKYIPEHLFYKEEQMNIDPAFIQIRNDIEWIIQINRVLKFTYYSIDSAFNEYKLSNSSPMTLKKNEHSEWFAYHIENAVFRLITITDLFKQLLNSFFEVGNKKEDNYTIYSLANALKSLNIKNSKEWGKKLLTFLYSDTHKYVRYSLRNKFTHSTNPNMFTIFHEIDSAGLVKPDIDFLFPELPLKELDKLTQDTISLVDLICDFNTEIENIHKKFTLVKPKLKLKCSHNYEYGNTTLFEELLDLSKKERFSIAHFEKCKNCTHKKEYKETMVCNILEMKYSRIHEDDKEFILFSDVK